MKCILLKLILPGAYNLKCYLTKWYLNKSGNPKNDSLKGIRPKIL
jgi:hypothetical protein